MKLERAKPEDAQEAIEWLVGNLGLNGVTPNTLKGCVFWKIPGVLYLPVKAVLMLESLAPNPEVKGAKRTLALRRALNDLRKQYPHTEIIFYSQKDARLNDAARRYGFEEAPYVVYRLIDAAEGRKRAKEGKRRLAEARLRNDAGTIRGPNLGATQSMPRVQQATRPIW